jgi:transposase-like protein
MHCPYCQKNNKQKSGKTAQGAQRWKCIPCNKGYTLQSYKRIQKKINGVRLFLFGFSLRNIGSLLNISHVAVFKWMKTLPSETQLFIETHRPKNAKTYFFKQQQLLALVQKKTGPGTIVAIFENGVITDENTTLIYLLEEYSHS